MSTQTVLAYSTISEDRPRFTARGVLRILARVTSDGGGVLGLPLMNEWLVCGGGRPGIGSLVCQFINPATWGEHNEEVRRGQPPNPWRAAFPSEVDTFLSET